MALLDSDRLLENLEREFADDRQRRRPALSPIAVLLATASFGAAAVHFGYAPRTSTSTGPTAPSSSPSPGSRSHGARRCCSGRRVASSSPGRSSTPRSSASGSCRAPPVCWSVPSRAPARRSASPTCSPPVRGLRDRRRDGGAPVAPVPPRGLRTRGGHRSRGGRRARGGRWCGLRAHAALQRRSHALARDREWRGPHAHAHQRLRDRNARYRRRAGTQPRPARGAGALHRADPGRAGDARPAAHRRARHRVALPDRRRREPRRHDPGRRVRSRLGCPLHLDLGLDPGHQPRRLGERVQPGIADLRRHEPDVEGDRRDVHVAARAPRRPASQGSTTTGTATQTSARSTAAA